MEVIEFDADEYKEIDDEKLCATELSNLIKAREIKKLLEKRYSGLSSWNLKAVKFLADEEVEGMLDDDKNMILFDVDCLPSINSTMDILIHEVSHIISDEYYHNETFALTMGEVAGYIIENLIQGQKWIENESRKRIEEMAKILLEECSKFEGNYRHFQRIWKIKRFTQKGIK